MSSEDDVSLILIALAIDSGVLFFLRSEALPLSGTIAILTPNMRCGGCKAAGIDREIWFHGGGREYRSSVGSLSLRRAGVCTVADRNSNRTSYQPGAYSNPQNELYVRESKNGESCSSGQTPKSAYAYASKSGFGLAKEYTMYQFTAGSSRIFCDLFPRIFAVSGALILSSTGRSRIVSVREALSETTISKENLGTLQST